MAEPNRLSKEKSPYLLQHAENPVDWYPWGDEAFQKSKKENKPIFLSIGYSTCHWCHVMEEESFTNSEIAKFLNEHFVSIKVDREERPDIDHVYMQAVMAMTGAGGWPMSVFLTPEREPFYGGTYFPPEDRWGRPGFLTVLRAIDEKWQSDREHIQRSAGSITQAVREETEASIAAAKEPGIHSLEKAFNQFESRFDETYGGFGGAPKFPSSHNLSFLLRYWKRTGEPRALFMVEKTLQEMWKGGMYDHLGGGFHRYSTDAQWRVPHFEKMLYDQAMLSRTYLEAYQATGNPVYANVAREILDYVLRDMTSPEGGFYSAEDADSFDTEKQKKVEGAFYVWTEDQIAKTLDPKERNPFFSIYSLGREGELYRTNLEGVSPSKEKLFKARTQRPRPHLDDKVLVDWNGLMIGSLAYGSCVLSEPRYTVAAQRAADFMMTTMIKDGCLLHRYREGEASISGFLEDSAFLGDGLLRLYEVTFEEKYLKQAEETARMMLKLFGDETGGGFFLTAQDGEALFVRPKSDYDGAIPSGQSMATYFLLRLARISGNREFEEKAHAALLSMSGRIESLPTAYTQTLSALDHKLGPSQEIVIAASNPQDPQAQSMVKQVFSMFLPSHTLAFRTEPGLAKAYICENSICKIPVNNVNSLKELLKGSKE